MSFRMIHCRQLNSEITEGLDLVLPLVEGIETAVNERSNAVFCICYSLIETICKTIMDERKEIDNTNDSLPKRFKNTLKLINIYPADYGGDTNSGIKKTLSGMETFLIGLCELRNNEGVFSHGRPATTQNLDILQIQMAANTADLLANYLYRAHLDYPMPPQEILYEDHTEFNDWIDDLNDTVEIVGQTFFVSWLLYSAQPDHESYIELLAEYQIELDLQETVGDVDEQLF